MINFFIFLYQKYLSPLSHFLGRLVFGPSYACRFSPTCSEYVREAFHKHSFFFAFYLSVTRFFRCHPFSQGGYDPVPDKIKTL